MGSVGANVSELKSLDIFFIYEGYVLTGSCPAWKLDIMGNRWGFSFAQSVPSGNNRGQPVN